MGIPVTWKCGLWLPESNSLDSSLLQNCMKKITWLKKNPGLQTASIFVTFLVLHLVCRFPTKDVGRWRWCHVSDKHSGVISSVSPSCTFVYISQKIISSFLFLFSTYNVGFFWQGYHCLAGGSAFRISTVCIYLCSVASGWVWGNLLHLTRLL